MYHLLFIYWHILNSRNKTFLFHNGRCLNSSVRKSGTLWQSCGQIVILYVRIEAICYYTNVSILRIVYEYWLINHLGCCKPSYFFSRTEWKNLLCMMSTQKTSCSSIKKIMKWKSWIIWVFQNWASRVWFGSLNVLRMKNGLSIELHTLLCYYIASSDIHDHSRSHMFWACNLCTLFRV